MHRFIGAINLPSLQRATFFLLLTLLLIGVNTACSWIKFTDEELKMIAPEWCADADAMVLDKSIEGEVYLTREGWELIDIQSIRIKIFTEEGKAQGTFPIVVQEGHKIKNIKARTISPEATITKVKKSQIIKKKTFGGVDNNQRYIIYQIAFPNVQIGSILELSFDSYTDNVYFMSPYYFDVRGLPTQSSTVKFSIPSIVSYLKSGMNTDLYDFDESIEEIKSLAEGNKIQYNGKAERIPALLNEPYVPGDDLIRPHIYFVFSQVRIGAKVHDIIPDWKSAVVILENIFDDYWNDKKVNASFLDYIEQCYPNDSQEIAIYRWVTDSVQWVDSRSWVDFEKHPSEVIETRCATGIEKALLMIKLYREAGITARLLLINPVNQSRTMTRLPNLLQFNTYLIRIENENTYQYIDPTKSHTAFGHYPWYFERASALLVDSTDSKIITIPTIDRINQESWFLNASLDTSGSLFAEGTLTFYHQYCQEYRDRISTADSSELSGTLRELANAEPNMKLLSFKYENDQETDTSITVSFSMQIDDYAEILGDDILFRPDFIQRMDIDIQNNTKPRLVDVYFSYPKRNVISMEITFPECYSIIDEPRRIRLTEIPKIQYRTDIIPVKEESKLLYRRSYIRESYFFPSSTFTDLCDFWRSAGSYDRVEVALTKAANN